jgi:hypothetical protein
VEVIVEFLNSVWFPISVAAVASGVSCWVWGYKRGYARATEDCYGPNALQQSAATLAVEDQQPDQG